jgi:endoribonuclease Nob1
MNPQASNQCKRAIVLDTSAFVAGFDPFSLSVEQVTVPKVEKEIIRNSMNKLRFETALENGRVKIKVPSQEFVNQILASSSKVGDSFKLSETDIELLALAIELKATGYNPQIVSDDYSIQNVAKQLDIEFSALATFGIKRLLEWIRYCPACYREYPANSSAKECKVCGTSLKRKPRRTIKKMKAK